MDRPPDGASDQQQRLVQWAEQQLPRPAPGASISRRLARLPRDVTQALRYPDTLLNGALANRFLDRDLHTTGG